jgi:hypothetical protein
MDGWVRKSSGRQNERTGHITHLDRGRENERRR